ncbi:MAG: hypothetical protein I8H70_02400 [Burkholderiales bacterium]|nr:hypothetical protein [Burkholderiales bacterium]
MENSCSVNVNKIMLRCTKHEMFQNIFCHADQAAAGPELFLAGIWLAVCIRLKAAVELSKLLAPYRSLKAVG